MPGALLIGDTAGLLNVPKIKGTHQAIRSGMLAAEHLVGSQLAAAGFDAKLRASDAMAELRKVRNIKPAFKRGLWFGMLNAAWETVTGGLSPWTLKNKPDWSSLDKLGECEAAQTRLRRAHAAAARPPGRRVLRRHRARRGPAGAPGGAPTPTSASTRCVEEYDNPCTRFCPAGVYEMVDDDAPHGKRLQINAANCVHCKTCDIKDPYEIITWVTPEGGAGRTTRTFRSA